MFWNKWRFNLRFRDDEPDFTDAESLPRKNVANDGAATPKKNQQKERKDSTDSDYKKKPTFWDHLVWNNKVRLFYVVLVCAILGILLPSVISYFLQDYSVELGSCSADLNERFPCLSGYSENLNSSACSNAGCCWDTQPGVRIKCFHVKPTRYTYKVKDPHNKTAVHLDPRYREKDPFQNPLQKIVFTIKAVNEHHLILMLYSTNSEQPPYRLLTEDKNLSFNQTVFDVFYSNSSGVREFGIVINRKDTGETLLDTTRGPLIISDNYVEFTTLVSQPVLYGLGLNQHRSLKRSFDFQNISMYTREVHSGFHPFYMAVEKSGQVHGLYWDNTHPLDVQLTPVPAVVFRSMGGSAVIHLLAGPSPKDVSHQYVMDLVGKIHLPPYWALGFHLCRESVNGSAFDVTFDAMQKASIGFDSDCIDFRLSGSTAMAVHSSNFPHAAQQRDKISAAKKKFIITQNPYVLSNATFDLLDLVSDGNAPFTGSVNNTVVYYPNYPDPAELIDPDSQLDFAGILDPDGFYFVNNYPLNEAPRTCVNDVPRKFYLEGFKSKGMTNTSICLEARHGENSTHIEKHNMYGVSHMNYVTEQYKRRQGEKRALIMNTASALGNLGKAGSTGDDFTADWTSMQSGLVQVLEMGLFGIPLAGVPICGSLDSTNAFSDDSEASRELFCLRWYQMSMFLPFAWSNNKLGHRLRSPIEWSPTAQRFIKGYIRQRYALLPYIYTLFYDASVEGYPVVRPLFYEFPSDNNTYEISNQFMLGNSIMVCPTTAPISDSLQRIYFPNTTWFDFYTGDVVKRGGGNANVSSPDGHINVYVRSGSIFVEQDASDSAESSRASSYTVTAAFPLAGNFTIKGHLYVDDGVTPAVAADFDLIEFTFERDNINIVVKGNNLESHDAISTTIDVIRIFGVGQKPDNVQQNGADQTFTYNSQNNVLVIEQVNFNWNDSDQTVLTINY